MKGRWLQIFKRAKRPQLSEGKTPEYEWAEFNLPAKLDLAKMRGGQIASESQTITKALRPDPDSDL